MGRSNVVRTVNEIELYRVEHPYSWIRSRSWPIDHHWGLQDQSIHQRDRSGRFQQKLHGYGIMRPFSGRHKDRKNHDLSQNSRTVFPLSRIPSKSFIDDLLEPKAVEVWSDYEERERGMISELSSFFYEIRRNWSSKDCFFRIMLAGLSVRLFAELCRWDILLI